MFLDVGAADGVFNSNTYRLEQLGWIGVLVEANPAEAELCARSRPASRVFAAAAVAPSVTGPVSFEVAERPGLSSLKINDQGRGRLQDWTGKVDVKKTTVQGRTADDMLVEAGVTHLDLVSVDVEGFEAGVLAGLNLRRWQPEVVIVERNTALPDRAVMVRLHQQCYEYEQTTGVNDWFAPGPVSPPPGGVAAARGSGEAGCCRWRFPSVLSTDGAGWKKPGRCTQPA